jgi:outer membrane biosynthesis protein TonB
MAMKRLGLLLLLGPLVTACASAQAKSAADRPTLEMPAVPPRVIEAAPPEPPPPEPVPDLPPAPAPPPPRARNAAPTRETAKPDPKPEPPPVEQPVVTPPAPALPQLRTPGTPEGPEASRQVGDVIERARKTLSSIDYRNLSTARKAEYDSAQLTIKQSENALKSGKFDIALNLAEKAEGIAKELRR